MSTEKRPNPFVTTIRNTLLSQVFQLLFAAAGGAGALTAFLGYLQGWPLAQIVTYAMVSAAAGAALIGYARRAIIDADLRHKFYVQDVQVVEEIGENNEVIGYLPWILLHNVSDIPLQYKIEDLTGNLNRLALVDVAKQPAMSAGHVQARQESWHGLGVVLMEPPQSNRMVGTMRLKISFGKTTNYIFDYKAAFDIHLLIDELGAVQTTRAFRR